MTQIYYFHIVCNESKYSGQGRTCYDAACNAIGSKRANLLAANTTQTNYKNKDEIVFDNEDGVSSFISKNNITIASVTRLII
jgi:hypothetical protein